MSEEDLQGASTQCLAGAEPLTRLDLEVTRLYWGNCKQGQECKETSGGKECLAEHVVRRRMGQLRVQVLPQHSLDLGSEIVGKPL